MIGATDRRIIAAARKLPCRSAILDGEVIVQDARGVSDFEALQTALRSQPTRLIFYAFDLIHLDGKDLRESPLVERRAKLQTLLRTDLESPLQFSEEFIGDAAAFFRACAAQELEGIVSKLATLAIEAVEARLGSRPSALPKASLRFSASTATARPERRVRCLPSQNAASLSMQDQRLSLFVQRRGKSSRLGSPNSSRSDQCFHQKS